MPKNQREIKMPTYQLRFTCSQFYCYFKQSTKCAMFNIPFDIVIEILFSLFIFTSGNDRVCRPTSRKRLPRQLLILLA